MPPTLTQPPLEGGIKRSKKVFHHVAATHRHWLRSGRKIFPFRKLPTELREKILICVLVNDEGIKPRQSCGYRTGDITKNRFLSIFLVSRQIYVEAKAVAYRLNVFHFNGFEALSNFAIGYSAPNSGWLLLKNIRNNMITQVVVTLDSLQNPEQRIDFGTLLCPRKYGAHLNSVWDGMKLVEFIFSMMPKLIEIKLHSKIWVPTHPGLTREGAGVLSAINNPLDYGVIQEFNLTIYRLKSKDGTVKVILPLPGKVRHQMISRLLCDTVRTRWQFKLKHIRDRKQAETELNETRNEVNI